MRLPSWPVFESFCLETPRATALYWLAVGIIVVALFVPRLLPCVDYPQHLALSDIARRLSDPSAPEHREYELNFFTYNGLFHFAVAWISRFLPIEMAGRLVVAGSLVGMASAVVALLRTVQRPPSHAALFTPVLFSFSLGWGFVNYALGTTISVWALVCVARAAARPTASSLVGVAALGMLCAFAHVLAMLILCAFGFALAVELSWRATRGSGPPWKRSALSAARTALALLPLLVGCLYCIEVFRKQYVWDPGMYRDPTIEGTAPPLWQKALYFGAFTLDLFGDATDQIVLWVSLGVMGWLAFMATRHRPSPPDPDAPGPLVAPFFAMAAAYFATPMVLIGTHLVFPRIGQWLVLALLLATPRFPDGLVLRGREYCLRLGLVAALSFLLHCTLFAFETNDASAVIDDLPPGRSITAVIWDPGTVAFRNGTLTHLAAYYAARKHGEWAFAFARYLSVPVRFRPHSQPAWPGRGWEFDGQAYDPRCKYARAFPLVIVKAPEEVDRGASGEEVVRRIVFKRDAAAPAVKLLSHHGRFWAFDTEGLPEDGTF
ncbi:MAG: hypothetical protein ABSC94_10975 [Polyangiaceae bacterium]|jgi:hypothetical protein